MLIAQITDTHIRTNGARVLNGKVDTSARLRATIEFLHRLNPRPDIVLATGDLVDDGNPGDYTQLTAILADLEIPVLPIPGNHDARAPFRAAFPAISAQAPGAFINYVVDGYPLRLVALDSTVDGEIGGDLCPERLDWLSKTLAQSTEPTLIFMHHPPFDFGIRPNKEMSCANAEGLRAVVSQHRSVVAILCGHLHRTTSMRWAGTVVGTCAAVAPVMGLDLAGNPPPGWIDTSPIVGLHLWKPEIGLLSHTMAIDEPATLNPFRAA